MTPEDIIRTLEQLAERLTPAGEYAFDLAMRQVVIEALLPWAVLLPLLAVTAIMVKVTRRLWADTDDSEDAMAFIFTVLTTLLAAVSTVAGLTGVSRLPALLNPEWAAIMKLMSLIP